MCRRDQCFIQVTKNDNRMRCNHQLLDVPHSLTPLLQRRLKKSQLEHIQCHNTTHYSPSYRRTEPHVRFVAPQETVSRWFRPSRVTDLNSCPSLIKAGEIVTRRWKGNCTPLSLSYEILSLVHKSKTLRHTFDVYGRRQSDDWKSFPLDPSWRIGNIKEQIWSSSLNKLSWSISHCPTPRARASWA